MRDRLNFEQFIQILLIIMNKYLKENFIKEENKIVL